jgi:hypothetical protein
VPTFRAWDTGGDGRGKIRKKLNKVKKEKKRKGYADVTADKIHILPLGIKTSDKALFRLL